MEKSLELTVGCQSFQRLSLQARRIAFDVVEQRWLEHEEPSVDPALACLRFLVEAPHRVSVVERKRAEARRRSHCRDGRDAAVGAVKRQQGANIDVPDAVTV